VRLGATMVAERILVDGLIVWDMLCGTAGRPCPKSESALKLSSGRAVPPPCLFLFPRNIPDPRNNPNPKVRKLDDASFLKALVMEFGCNAVDLTDVNIQARMDGANVVRKTTLTREGRVVCESDWTELKRASR